MRNYSLVGGNWVQGKTIDYRYDVFDRLAGRTVDNTHDGTIDAEDAYVYDGQNPVLQFHKNGSGNMSNADLSRRFLNGPAVDQVFAEEVLSGATSVETRWLLADNQGTVRDVAVLEYNEENYDYETRIKDHLVYDGFGNFTESDANYRPAVTYAGYRQDPDTGLFYASARWYDAKTARWLKPQTSTIATNPPSFRLHWLYSAKNARTGSHFVLTCRRTVASPASLRSVTVNCLQCWSMPRYNILGSPGKSIGEFHYYAVLY